MQIQFCNQIKNNCQSIWKWFLKQVWGILEDGPGLWPITDGKRETGGCFLSMGNCECDGKEEPKEPLWSASSIARTFLPCGSNLRKAMLSICLLSYQFGTSSRAGVKAAKAFLPKAEPCRYELHSGKFSCLEQGQFAFWLGTWFNTFLWPCSYLPSLPPFQGSFLFSLE